MSTDAEKRLGKKWRQEKVWSILETGAQGDILCRLARQAVKVCESHERLRPDLGSVGSLTG